MLKAQECYYKGLLESLLEKTNEEGQQTRGPMAMATEALSLGSSQLLLALSLLWQETLLCRSRQQRWMHRAHHAIPACPTTCT